MKKAFLLTVFCSLLFLGTEGRANNTLVFQSENPAFSHTFYSAFLYKTVTDTIPSGKKPRDPDSLRVATYYYAEYYEKYRDKKFEMPGYTGRIACNWPINENYFESIKDFIAEQPFESRRLAIAKEIVSKNCFTSRQIRHLAALFDFESSKLEFLKFAYSYTYDIDNYFIVMDVLDFNDSIKKLDAYIKAYE
jgi:hypothetical protein